MFHSSVYAMAEKYLMEDLKSLAPRNFMAQLPEPGSLRQLHVPAVVEAALHVYSSTVHFDRGLRILCVINLGTTTALWTTRMARMR